MAGRLIVIGILAAAHCAGTTIVLIRTPNHVIVGADSLVVAWHAHSHSQAVYTCKVHKQALVFFTITGIGVVHAASNFSAEKLVRHAISSSGSMEEAAAHFARTSLAPYGRVVAAMKIEDPKEWRLIEKRHGTAIPLVVILFGLERGTVKYVIVGLRVSTGTHLIVSADYASCPGPACEGAPNGESALVVGQSEAAYRQIGGFDQSSFSQFRKAAGDVAAVKKLIALEATAVPDLVGGAVHVVTVDAKGEHWDVTAGVCN